MPSNPTRERGQRRAFGECGTGACSEFCVVWLVPCTATLHEPDHTLHAPVSTRKHGVGPPHHLTTSPHHGERNTRTRQRRAAVNCAPKRPAFCRIWLVRCNSKRLPRARSLAARSGVLMEARRWSLGSSSYRVCEFVLVTDHNSLS